MLPDLDWQQTDKKILRRINTLMKEIKRNPVPGLGKRYPFLIPRFRLILYFRIRFRTVTRLIPNMLTRPSSRHSLRLGWVSG